MTEKEENASNAYATFSRAKAAAASGAEPHMHARRAGSETKSGQVGQIVCIEH